MIISLEAILLIIVIVILIVILIRLKKSMNAISKSQRLVLSPTNILYSICEKYWRSQDPGPESIVTIPDQEYAVVVEILESRGHEATDWALENLEHDYFDARKTCAFLVGEYCRFGFFKNREQEVVDKLGALAWRAVNNDQQDEEAIKEAINALGKTKHDSAKHELLRIIESEPEHFDEETKLIAVESLEKITNVQFMFEESPVNAAIVWMRSS